MSLTAERRTDRYIEEQLKQPHHPFLEQMRDYFPPTQFRALLNITYERLGTLNPDGGEIPVFDTDVLQTTTEVLRAASSHLDAEEMRQLTAAAYFSIWAYGTNPNAAKRFRHELKPNSDIHQPYAMHPARVAKRLFSFDLQTLQTAFLHDVPEDTPYTFEDITHLFSYQTSRLTNKVTKISTDKLEDVNQVEAKVAEKFLLQFIENEDAATALKILEQASVRTVTDADSSIKYSPSLRELIKKSGFDSSFSVKGTLNKYAKGKSADQLLTLLRLLSGVSEKPSIRSLIAKCADVADNMASLNGLASAKGKKRAQEKAKLALSVFAPLARILGLGEMASEIENAAFAAFHPARAEKIDEQLRFVGEIDRQDLHELEQRTNKFITKFFQWANMDPALQLSSDAVSVSFRFPTIYEIAHNNISLQKPLRPFILFEVSDPLVGEALQRYFRSGLSDENGLSAREIKTNGQDNSKRLKLKVKYANHWQKMTGFIQDTSGTIADLYRPGSSDYKKYIGNSLFITEVTTQLQLG